jgi:predicted transcriptional regulator
MPTPTMSVRALPEHHQLLRRMARALMDRPELAESLTALIEGVPQSVPQEATRPSAAVDQRFEDIERRLAQVESQGVLRGETPDVLREVQGVVQAIQEHLMRQEQTTLKYVAMTENLSDRVRDLERPADPQQAATRPVQHKAVTQQPRQPPVKQDAGGGKAPTEQDLQIAEMLKAGRSYREIAKAVGIHHGALTRIKKRLERQGLVTVADPDGHVENPETPVD